MEENKKKPKKIKPSLFKLEMEYSVYYVVAYDAKHALESLPNYESRDLEQLKGITNLLGTRAWGLYIAPECLGAPGLVDKIKKEE
jgi:hypothetical protein